MIIEMLFSSIKDMSKLYQKEMVPAENLPSGKDLFVGNEPTLTWNYLGKEYCEQIMHSVSENIAEVDEYSYQACFGRAANEIFVMLAGCMTYTISCTIDTYEYKTARLTLKIETEHKADGSHGEIQNLSENNYDLVLEKLKIELKKAFLPDWESCVWIRDEQSEQLCAGLCPKIFKTENQIRAFVNKILIWYLGPKWLDNLGLEKYAESCKERAKDFRSNVPDFADVDDALISATLETLFEIVTKGKIYEPEFKLQKQEYDHLIELAKKGKADIAAYLQKHRTVKYDLWKDIFEQYLTKEETDHSQILSVSAEQDQSVQESENVSPSDSESSTSQQIITDFIKNRNHIAHNKPLTFLAFKRMRKSVSDMSNLIAHANYRFEGAIPSNELEITWGAEQDELEAELTRKDWERNYLRYRIEGETGVEIRWHEDIFNLFVEKMDSLYSNLYDCYYFDEQYEISTRYDINDTEEWQTVFTVFCRACDDYSIDVQISIIINDEMDGDSYLYLRYIKHNGDEDICSGSNALCTPAMHYHNGSGSEDFEIGGMAFGRESKADTSELAEFIEDLKDAINSLNPYIPQIGTLEYESAKEGTQPPVADFPCWECGKYGVSLREDFYPFGHCCYCGSDNEVEICDRCGSCYNGTGGKAHLCSNCISDIESQ